MSQTLTQKRHRKLKKFAKKNKARVGKKVIFTDQAGDAERKKNRLNAILLAPKEPIYRNRYSYPWED